MEERSNIPDLLFRYFIGTLDASGRQELEEWLDRSEDNRALLNKYKNTEWVLTESQRIDAIDDPPPLEELLKTINARTPSPQPSAGWKIVRAAACLILVAASVYALVRWYKNYKPEISDPEPEETFVIKEGFGWIGKIGGLDIFQWIDHLSFLRSETETRYDKSSIELSTTTQPRTIELPDGSVSKLDTLSSLHFSNTYGNLDRDLQLSGEAVFDVRSATKSLKPSTKPFVVQVRTNDHRTLKIIAIGTFFRVRAYPKEKNIQTFLEKGHLLIKRNDTILCDLNEREVFVLDPEGHFTKHPMDSSAARPPTRPDRDDFFFDNKPVTQILTSIGKWYKVRFVYTEKLKDSFSVMGHRSELLEEVLRGIPLHFDRKGDSIIVSH